MVGKEDMVVVCKEGFYCLFGDFYIDFWWLVVCVVIMYVYVDYVCVGYGYYLVVVLGVGILCVWLGVEINL